MILGLWIAAAAAGEVVVWHAWRGAEEAALVEAATAFEATQADRVRLVPLPFGALDSKVETAVPRGNGPDLILAGHGAVGRWTEMGLLETPELDRSAHLPVTVEAVTWDGAPRAAPLAFKSLLLLYDPTTIDTPPTTTDALLTLAREHTHDGHYGLAFQAAEPYFFAPFLHAYGGRTLDGSRAQLDDDAHVQALSLVRNLAVDAGVAPAQATGELVGRLYGEGRLSFVISGPWFVADQTRPIAAAPLPSVPGVGPLRPYLTVDAGFLPILAHNAPGGRAFLAHLAGPPGAAIRATTGRQAVSLVSVVPSDPLLVTLTAQAAHAVPMPADPALSIAFEAQARALRATLRGSTSPAEAAAAAQRWFDVLAKPLPPPADPRPYLAVVALVLLTAVGLAARRLADPDLRSRLTARRHDYLWILPAALPIAVLVLLPFLTGAAVSLFAHRGGTWTFVGLTHFVDLLLSRDWPITQPLSFWYTLVVTLLWTATNLCLHVALGVAAALVLREPFIRLRPLWRALLILPWAVPNYITALIWKAMFHHQLGAVNALLGWLSGQRGPADIDWFSRFSLAFCANLATNTWLGFPFMMVITLGALQSIPKELEEAAEVDGATWIQRFRHVVWPLLRPALVPAILMGSVWTFNMFNVVYLVSAGEPDGATEILISDAYRWAFSRGNRYGYASAYAVLIFGVLVVYTRFANRIAGRRVL